MRNEGQEGGGKKKNGQIRDGIEDMSGIDGVIMVKLGHEGKMRGFSEGGEKRGTGDSRWGQGLWSH